MEIYYKWTRWTHATILLQLLTGKTVQPVSLSITLDVRQHSLMLYNHGLRLLSEPIKPRLPVKVSVRRVYGILQNAML